MGGHVRRRRGGVAELVVLQLGLADLLGQPPVDHERLAEGAEEDVVGLEVPVQHALVVGVGDGLAHGGDRREQRHALGQRGRLLDGGVQRGAVHQLHRVVGQPLGIDPLAVDRHDGGVLQAGGDAGLALEAGAEVGVVGEELLDGDGAVEGQIPGAEDATHAAAGHLGAQPVREVRGGRRGRRRWRGEVVVDPLEAVVGVLGRHPGSRGRRCHRRGARSVSCSSRSGGAGGVGRRWGGAGERREGVVGARQVSSWPPGDRCGGCGGQAPTLNPVGVVGDRHQPSTLGPSVGVVGDRHPPSTLGPRGLGLVPVPVRRSRPRPP